MKNVLLLEHYYSPDELSSRLREWVAYYNHRRAAPQRYHDRVAGAIIRKRTTSRWLLGPSRSDLSRTAKNQAFVDAFPPIAVFAAQLRWGYQIDRTIYAGIPSPVLHHGQCPSTHGN